MKRVSILEEARPPRQWFEGRGWWRTIAIYKKSEDAVRHFKRLVKRGHVPAELRIISVQVGYEANP